MRQLQKKIKSGTLNLKQDDPFELFVAATNIRYCYYKETHKILGNTFGMCVLQVSHRQLPPDCPLWNERSAFVLMCFISTCSLFHRTSKRSLPTCLPGQLRPSRAVASWWFCWGRWTPSSSCTLWLWWVFFSCVYTSCRLTFSCWIVD